MNPLEIFSNKDSKERGQSLIELLVAVGLFVAVVSAVGLLIMQSRFSNLKASQHSQASFLVHEAMEAVRSIRDNNWDDLLDGSHGLAISSSRWVFQGTEEDISSFLNKGKRKVIIESIDADRKKITSQVTWENPRAEQTQVALVSYLSNWQKLTADYCEGIPTPCSAISNRGACQKQDGCFWQGKSCLGESTTCENFLTKPDCNGQDGCQWISY